MLFERLLKIAAWLSLAVILFVTISPVGLRPHDLISGRDDRALAFAAMALLFVVAYPRRFWACAVLTILGAAAMELLQDLSPSRHARPEDATVKAVGAAIGVGLGFAANRLLRRRSD